MRRRPRVDAPHGAIRDALRRIGCDVLSLAALGSGAPDLLVHAGEGRLLLLEVKDGTKPPSERQLTPAEQRFGVCWPVHVVTSVDEALAIVTGPRVRRGGDHPHGRHP